MTVKRYLHMTVLRIDVADDERSFVFFEKSGKWYFYIHNNKSENYSKNNKCTGIYNAETGNMDYKLMVDTLDTCQMSN